MDKASNNSKVITNSHIVVSMCELYLERSVINATGIRAGDSLSSFRNYY